MHYEIDDCLARLEHNMYGEGYNRERSRLSDRHAVWEHIRDQEREIARLTAENAELRKDAERWRSVRREINYDCDFPHVAIDKYSPWGKRTTRVLCEDEADAAIDATMGEP